MLAFATMLVVDRVIPSLKTPGQQRRKREERVRNALARDLGESSKDDRKDHHREERLDYGPGDTEARLLVPDLNVSPDEEVRAVPRYCRDLIEIDRNPLAGGPDDQRREVGEGRDLGHHSDKLS